MPISNSNSNSREEKDCFILDRHFWFSILFVVSFQFLVCQYPWAWHNKNVPNPGIPTTNHALKVSAVFNFCHQKRRCHVCCQRTCWSRTLLCPLLFAFLRKVSWGVIQNNSVIAVNNITWLIKVFFSGVAGTASLSVRGAHPIMTSRAHHNKLDGAVPPNDVYHLTCRCRDLITFPSLGVKLSIYPWAGLTRRCLARLWVHNAWKDIYRGR